MKRATMFLIFILAMAIYATPSIGAEVSLAWDPSPSEGVIGYKLYYGNASGAYTEVVDAGDVLAYTITGLDVGKTYYFAATAYNPDAESGYSNEVSKYFAYPAPEPPGNLREQQTQVHISFPTSTSYTLVVENTQDSGSGE